LAREHDPSKAKVRHADSRADAAAQRTREDQRQGASDVAEATIEPKAPQE
jgi:hypothetical protein